MVKLDSIWETEKGNNRYKEVKEELLKRYNMNTISALRSDFYKTNGYESGKRYGTNTYHGEITVEKYKDLTELELAMILDCGYSFFGGHSRIVNNKFNIEIWID